MSIFKTCHQGLASFLRYAKGDAAHLRTVRDESGRMAFEFTDDGTCEELSYLFFSDDCGEGAAVGNARALLECQREIRKTISDAINNSGEWRNDNG